MKKNLFRSPFFLKYHRLISDLPDFNIKTNDFPFAWKKVYFKEYPRFPQYFLPPLKNLPQEINLFKILQKRRTRRLLKKIV